MHLIYNNNIITLAILSALNRSTLNVCHTAVGPLFRRAAISNVRVKVRVKDSRVRVSVRFSGAIHSECRPDSLRADRGIATGVYGYIYPRPQISPSRLFMG